MLCFDVPLKHSGDPAGQPPYLAAYRPNSESIVGARVSILESMLSVPWITRENQTSIRHTESRPQDVES